MSLSANGVLLILTVCLAVVLYMKTRTKINSLYRIKTARDHPSNTTNKSLSFNSMLNEMSVGQIDETGYSHVNPVQDVIGMDTAVTRYDHIDLKENRTKHVAHSPSTKLHNHAYATVASSRQNYDEYSVNNFKIRTAL
jgi:hypothetical protein